MSERRSLILASVVLVAILAGLFFNNQRSDNYPTATALGSFDSAQEAMVKSFLGDSMAYDGEDTALVLDESRAGATAADVDQRIIKTADLELAVDSAAQSAAAMSDLAENAGGFVQSSSVTEDAYGGKRGYVTIRVPVDAFEATIEDVKALADSVVTESVNGQDVTEAYTDLAARLGAAQAQEAQYLLILASAETVGEVLAVHEHLADVRMQIESLQGQLQYLENRTSYSTISATLTESTRVTIPSEKFELWEEVVDAAHTLVVLGQKILTGIVWTIIVAGPFAILLFAGYKVIMAIRRRR